MVGVAALPASADQGRGSFRSQVQISRVQYDSPGWDNGSNDSLNREWVDITNTGRQGVNLDDWTLSGRDGRTYTFDHLRLGGRSTVRVHTGIGRDTGRDVFQDRRRYAWDNYADTASLRNDRNRLVDAVSWGGRNGRGHGLPLGHNRPGHRVPVGHNRPGHQLPVGHNRPGHQLPVGHNGPFGHNGPIGHNGPGHQLPVGQNGAGHRLPLGQNGSGHRLPVGQNGPLGHNGLVGHNGLGHEGNGGRGHDRH